ncbi:MAG: sigma-70 family RNA polymerase sigma factor [Candidatus Nomurabacteria bacterium]|nr:sigma-70 family RNA polymerase sigma factor [Candidatus Nomurabacteria bacterium]
MENKKEESKSLTNVSGSLPKYLKEIEKEEKLTVEQENQLSEEIRNGSALSLEKLIKSNLRLVKTVADQFKRQGMLLQDLINEGNLGLIEAAKSFDERRGFVFKVHATREIKKSIRDALMKKTKIIRLPFNEITSKKQIEDTKENFIKEFGYEASTEELSAILGKNEEDISDTMYFSQETILADSPIDEENTLLDTLSDTATPTGETFLIDESLKKEIERALKNLKNPRQVEVLKLFFGFDEGINWTLESIGSKFNLTRESARQIKEKAIKRLRKQPNIPLLKSYLG